MTVWLHAPKSNLYILSYGFMSNVLSFKKESCCHELNPDAVTSIRGRKMTLSKWVITRTLYINQYQNVKNKSTYQKRTFCWPIDENTRFVSVSHASNETKYFSPHCSYVQRVSILTQTEYRNSSALVCLPWSESFIKPPLCKQLTQLSRLCSSFRSSLSQWFFFNQLPWKKISMLF